MNLDPAPRLPKWPFILVDCVLLGTIYLIATFAKDPFSPVPFLSCTALVVLGITAFLAPFLIDYARAQEEAARALHDAMEGQLKRLHAANESLTRNAAHAKAVEEAAHKTMHAAENLPYRMQEKLAEFNQALEQAEDEEKENMAAELAALRQSEGEKLQAVADKIHKTTAEMAALEKATRAQLGAAELKLQQLVTTLAESAQQHEQRTADLQQKLAAQAAAFDAAVTAAQAALAAAAAALTTQSRKLTVPERPVAPEPIPVAELPPAASVATPAVEMTPAPVPAEEPPTAAVPEAPAPAATVEATAPAASPEPTVAPAPEPVAPPAEPKPRKPRAPRKPKAETPPAVAEPTAEAAPAAEPVAAPPEPPPPAAEPAPPPVVAAEPEPSTGDDALPLSNATESSAASDGATRLLATAYIGIGNKLFIRGAGPGLSWDRGAPMQFISIGKWGWHTHEATTPVRCKLYKNDEAAALGGEIVLEPGRHVEVSAMF
jgi:hypothetical protein